MRRICLVTSHRSDFSRLEPVLTAMRSRPDLQVSLIVSGGHLLPDAGQTLEDIRSRFHGVDWQAYTIVEGENLETMSKSIGLGCIEFATVFQRFTPDIVVVHGDRFDIFPAAIAAAMANIRIAHLQGGEVTGTIDESVRHCITKLSHLHFVSNDEAAARVAKLGEDPTTIFITGCPSVDAIKSLVHPAREVFAMMFHTRYGGEIDLCKPYLILIQHPVTTEFVHAAGQMEMSLRAAAQSGFPTILIYPNIDAGSKQMASRIRRMSGFPQGWLVDMFKHVSPIDFWTLLKYSSCIVGNSSAGIRESCYFGTPCVNIGSRQHRRARGGNVTDVAHDVDAIVQTIVQQVEHGIYPVEELYGDGHAAHTIAQIVAQSPLPSVQKTITY